MIKVYTYLDEEGIFPVLDFLNKSDSRIKDKLKYQIAFLNSSNHYGQEPHIKHFLIEKYKQFYEFRIRISGKNIRIIYCEKDRNIILLYAFHKKSKRDTQFALDHSIKVLNYLKENDKVSYEKLKEVNF